MSNGCATRFLTCVAPIIGCLFFLAPLEVAAQNPEVTGFYGRAGASVGVIESERLERLNARLPALLIERGFLPANARVLEARVDVDALLGASIGLGWRFHPRWAIEASFAWMEARADFSLSFVTPAPLPDVTSGVTNAGQVSAWNFVGEAKGYLMTGIIQPYGSLGLGVMSESAELGPENNLFVRWKETGFAPRFGGGLDLILMPRIALNLDAGYFLGTGSLAGEDLISIRLGVIGRF